MIETKSLNFRYEEKVVIDDITFSVSEGEFIGIIGPNGAGKSTLLRLLVGILKADSGEIILAGREINSYKRLEIAQFVSFIPQETYFSLDYNVFDVVMQGRYPHLGFFKIESYDDRIIVKESLARTGIEDLANKEILSISSGERQLVVITRAIAQSPKILLLDEPTTFLDIKHQLEIMKLLKDLNNEGITVIIVVHDLNIASLFCSNVLLLDKGKLVDSGPPDKIINKELIKKVYGLNVVDVPHPTRDVPQILLDH